MTTVHGGGPRMESGVPDASDKSGEFRGGCGRFLFGSLLAAGLCAHLLHDFATTHVLIALTVLGPAGDRGLAGCMPGRRCAGRC